MNAMVKHAGLLLLLLMVLLLQACAGSKPRPAWLDDTGGTLRGSTYLVATARHKYPKNAKHQARDMIIDQLKMNAPLTTRFTVKDNPATALLAEHRARLLENINIVDTWAEPGSARHHVLAGITRAEAAAALRELVTRLDELTRDQIEQAGKQRDPIQRIVLAGTAVEAQALRRRFAGVMKIIYPQRPVTREIWQQQRLEGDYTRLLRRIRIFPLITNDDSQVLGDTITEALRGAGFQDGRQGNADFQLDTALYIDKRAKDQEGERIRGRLSLQLKDRKHGLRGSEEWPVEFLIRDGDTAEAVIAATLKQRFAQDLLPTILSFSGTP